MHNDLAIGIDLGTSYSCVSVVEGGVARVIPNERGELTHASVVHFCEDGTVTVGNAARRARLGHGDRVVSSAKRLIGRYFFSEEVQRARELSPVELVEGPNRAVRIRVGGRELSVPEVSALVLKELRTLAERHLGRPVTRAVITCPAYFNDNQRQATRDAARIAGLDVLRLVNEPTAAALACGLGRRPGQRVAIYDLGGGTFDVSVLQVGEDVFEVLSTAGDTYLGGDDFDERIAGWLAEDFLRRTGIDLRQDPGCVQRLKEAGEHAKLACSRQGFAEVRLEGICQDPSGRVLDLQARLEARELEGLLQDLLQRTFRVCDEALRAARMGPRDVDAVVLVGGSTRLPLVRAAVRAFFGREPLSGVDPDHAVAIGAAMQAHSLLDEEQATCLLDVTPLPLRIATVGGFTETVLDKNTPVPSERTRVFTTSRDGQDKVKIRVLQGESAKESDCESLGEFEFSGFRVAHRGEVRIEVTFELDTDGIVHVAARDLETGLRTSRQIHLSAGLTEEEIERSIVKTNATVLNRAVRGG